LLRDRISRYTERICAKHHLPTQTVRYSRALFDHTEDRWISKEYHLPINPFNDTPILLTPRRYLRLLPTINPFDYWSYCYDFESGRIAEMFGDDIVKRANKEAIIKFATAYPDTRERYIRYREDIGSEAYDFPNDPKGIIKWYEETKSWVENHPLRLSFSSTSGGWELLWNDDHSPKAESAAQLLFLGIVKHYCKANDVDISKEANIGRGPVDFKLSNGYVQRALIEVKLAKNTKFWRGLEKQLPKYMEAEDVTSGRFIVIAFNDKDLRRIPEIERRTSALNEKTPFEIRSVVIDAQAHPPSASKL